MFNQNFEEMRKLLTIMLVMAGIAIPMRTMSQTKTIYVTPEEAKIFYNGHEVGNGTYQVKFKRTDDFAIFKFEAPGYITKKVKVFRTNPNKTLTYNLMRDEAMANSVGGEDGVDIANKFFIIKAKDELTEMDVWKRIVNVAINHFENIETMDKVLPIESC